MKITPVLLLVLAFLGSLSASKQSSRKLPGDFPARQSLSFIENKGQERDPNGNPAPGILFKGMTDGMNVYITEQGLTYMLYAAEQESEDGDQRDPSNQTKKSPHEYKWERVELKLAGATIRRENIVAESPSVDHLNFFLAHCPEGITNVKSFGKVTILDVFPGIDWVFHSGGTNGFKYDFVVKPGADPARIKMYYKSVSPVKLDDNGNLLITGSIGTLIEKAPYTFKLRSGTKVASRFEILSSGERKGYYETLLGFHLESVDPKSASETTVIDPQLVWSTFYGGGVDGFMDVKTDPAGNIFVTGYNDGGFPLMNAGTYFQGTFLGVYDAILIKFDGAGVRQWATYYSGTDEEYADALAFNAAGDVFVTGYTYSTDFPTQNAGGYFQGTNAGSADMFILKFSNNGTRLWATYYGGTGYERGWGVTVDRSGRLIVCGVTFSSNFPTQNAGGFFQGNLIVTKAGVMVEFDAQLTRIWSTYYGDATCYGITVDNKGQFFIIGLTSNGVMPCVNPGGGAYYQNVAQGVDAFVSKFDSLTNHVWCTLYGGSGTEYGLAIALGKAGQVYIGGRTESTDLPLLNSGQFFQANLVPSTQLVARDAFIVKFNNSGVRQWATYFGGQNEEIIDVNSLAVDKCGRLFAGLTTESNNLPLLSPCDGGYFDGTFNGGQNDTYLARFGSNDAFQWGTFFSGFGNDFRAPIAVSNAGDLIAAGEWAQATSTTYPLSNPGNGAYYDSTFNAFGLDDSFVARFVMQDSLPAPSVSYAAPLCIGGSTILPTLNFTLSGSYYSSDAGLSIDPVTGMITPSLSSIGSHTVYYSGSLCRCVSGSTVITIQPGLTLTVTGVEEICKGSTLLLTAVGANSYSWSTGASISTVAVSPNATSVYTVTGTGGNNCSGVKTVTVNVKVCEGIGEVTYAGAFLNVYSNPNSGEFVVECNVEITLQLITEDGRVLREIMVNDMTERKATVKGLSSGIYFLVEKAGAKAKRYGIRQKVVVE